ncbi:hypothetical protein HDZ31DRAFT_66859 [Schizophyllum fasciatum]
MSPPKFVPVANLMPHAPREAPDAYESSLPSLHTSDASLVHNPIQPTARSFDAPSHPTTLASPPAIQRLNAPTLHTLMRRAPNSGTVIAGVVVGVVAFLILLGVAYGVWRRRRGPPREMLEERGAGEDMDDGEHYDADIQNAADNGVRGSKLYGPSGHRNTLVLDGPVMVPASPGGRASVSSGGRVGAPSGHTPLRSTFTAG